MALELLDAIKFINQSCLSDFAKHALIRGLAKEESALLQEYSNKQANLQEVQTLNKILL